MRSITKNFSLLAGYDRYFYVVGEHSYIPYRNAISVTPVLEFRPFVLSTTYSFYFGDSRAHRIMPGISIVMEKKKLINIDRVAITPSFFMLLGNEIFTEMEFIAPRNRLEGLFNLKTYNSWFKPVQTERNVFGIMNYAISIPVSIIHKNWGFSFSYTYNIPKALPGETLIISESSYLSGSITYFISLNRHKLSL